MATTSNHPLRPQRDPFAGVVARGGWSVGPVGVACAPHISRAASSSLCTVNAIPVAPSRSGTNPIRRAFAPTPLLTRSRPIFFGRAGSGKVATFIKPLNPPRVVVDSNALLRAAATLRVQPPRPGSWGRATHAEPITDVDVILAIGAAAPALKRGSLASVLRVLKHGWTNDLPEDLDRVVLDWLSIAWDVLSRAPARARETLIDVLRLARIWIAAIVSAILVAAPKTPMRVATDEIFSVITGHGPPAALATPRPHAVVSA